MTRPFGSLPFFRDAPDGKGARHRSASDRGLVGFRPSTAPLRSDPLDSHSREATSSHGSAPPAIGLAEVAFAASPDGMVVIDAGGKVLHANRAAETLLGEAGGEPGTRRLVGLELPLLLGAEPPFHNRLFELPGRKGPRFLTVRASSSRAAGDDSVSVVTFREVGNETQEALAERVKELRTLYAMSRELGRTALPLPRRLERIVDLLPGGWLHPKITEARIAWGDVAVASSGFRDTSWRLVSEIRLQGEAIGAVEVVLTEARPEQPGGEGPFLPEERELIDAVATAVGEAIERDRLHNEFVQGQKLETIGQLAGGVAHDFNNLLMVIRGHAEMAVETVAGDATLEDDLRRILEATRRGGELTRQLLAFSRRQALEERFVDLRDQVGTLEPMLRSLVPGRIELRIDTAADRGPVRVDPAKLDQVVLNLVANAVDSIETRGSIEIRLGTRRLGRREAAAIPWRVRPGPYATLVVRDTGDGMPPRILDRIFEPFFTTKPEGRGTGLGLSVVFGIVKQSGGHVFVESEPGAGTAVEILLPRAEPEEADARPPEAHARPPAANPPAPGTDLPAGVEAAGVGADGQAANEPPIGGGAILLVEDDPSVRDVMGRILAREGHRVILATDGREALQALVERGSEIDLVVSDVVMPGMGGVEFVDTLRRLRPGLQVVLMSGYAEKELTAGVRDRVAGFLEKPFSPHEVIGVIRGALG